jgi:hypothetical protein
VWIRQQEDGNQRGGKARAFAQLTHRSSPNRSPASQPVS